MNVEMTGFETRMQEGFTLLARAAFSELLRETGLQELLSGAADKVKGRRLHAVVELPDGGRAVVRRCVHGGLLGPVLGETYLGARRFLEEARVSEHLRSRGVNTPEIIGLIVRANAAGLCRGAVVTRMIEGGRDLLEFLRSREGKQCLAERGAKRNLVRLVAFLVRQMHDAGVSHPDLHVKNILLAPGWQVHVIDLDSARLQREVGPARRVADLMRLARSLEKTGLDRAFSRRDACAFLLEYMRAGPGLDIDPRRVARRYRRHVAFHRLFWKAQAGE